MKNSATQYLIASFVLLMSGMGQAETAPGQSNDQVLYARTVDAGRLFLNGRVIDSPVQLEVTAAGVFANGVAVPVASAPTQDELYDLEAYDSEFSRPRRDRARKGNAKGGLEEPNPSAESIQYARRLAILLDQGLAVVVFENEQIRTISLATDLLVLYDALLAESPSEVQRASFLELAPNEGCRAKWGAWLSEFTPEPAFAEEMQAFLNYTREGEATLARQERAAARLEMFAYPLTALAMIISVFGFGHLLQWVAKGFADQETTESDSHWSERNWFITTAILLMVVMSALDLAWTILASQAGIMAEVNPVARGMVSDPWSLALFKVAAMGIALVILYFWRHRRQIQQATWWTCLVCVLLMFRWVIFDSMSM
ncbi:MAG: DUF5658 family protein [Planctomycetaceae bacterium]